MKQKNKRNAVNSTFLLLFTNAADRNRTGTGITTHGILSPGRLPVPPRRHMKNKKVLAVMQYLMDGGGFEPPKQFAADLQSVPFGHSGIHPCAELTGITQSPDKLYLYHNPLQKATVFSQLFCIGRLYINCLTFNLYIFHCL